MGGQAPLLYTSDHHLYDRREAPIPAELLSVVPGIVEYVVKHDPTRCRPFGVFDVYRRFPEGDVHVGSQLSRPSKDDCTRISSKHFTRHVERRTDPTLPEELRVLRLPEDL